MTLDDFRKTGRDVIDLGEELGFDGFEGQAGRVYHGQLYLELQVDGQWSLTIGNQEWWEPTREGLEQRLYDFGRSEGYFDAR